MVKKLENKTRVKGALEAIVATVAAEDLDFRRFLRDFQTVYGE